MRANMMQGLVKRGSVDQIWPLLLILVPSGVIMVQARVQQAGEGGGGIQLAGIQRSCRA